MLASLQCHIIKDTRKKKNAVDNLKIPKLQTSAVHIDIKNENQDDAKQKVEEKLEEKEKGKVEKKDKEKESKEKSAVTNEKSESSDKKDNEVAKEDTNVRMDGTFTHVNLNEIFVGNLI